jgi:hypothetical protein
LPSLLSCGEAGTVVIISGPKGDGIYLTNNLTGKKFLEIVEARKKTNGIKSKKEENNFQSEHNFFHNFDFTNFFFKSYRVDKLLLIFT